MKNYSNILKYPIMVVTFILVLVVLDELLGKAAQRNFWDYLVQGGALLIAVLIADVAEKHGWDTWSGLIGKLKKNK